MLIDLHVATMLCCGGTTRGCVCATVVDAFTHNFRVAVVQEATFDRTESSHAIDLFDIQQKYDDVVSMDSAMANLLSHPREPRNGRFEG